MSGLKKVFAVVAFTAVLATLFLYSNVSVDPNVTSGQFRGGERERTSQPDVSKADSVRGTNSAEGKNGGKRSEIREPQVASFPEPQPKVDINPAKQPALPFEEQAKIQTSWWNIFGGSSEEERMTIVTIVKAEDFKKSRHMFGHFHKHHPSIRILVYALDLTKSQQSGLQFLRGVDVIDLKQHFVTSAPTEDGFQLGDFVYDISTWRPIVIADAVKRFSKVLWVHPNYYPAEPLTAVWKELTDSGHYFVCADKATDKASHDIQGYTSQDQLFNNYFLNALRCTYRESCRKDIGLRDGYLHDIPFEKCDPSPPLKVLTSAQTKGDKAGMCYSKFREDIFYDVPFAHSLEVSEQKTKKKDTQTYIALGVPSVGSGQDVEALTFYRIFLTSLLPTIDPNDDSFLIVIHLGFDDGDPFYDSPNGLQSLKEHFNKLFKSHSNVQLKTYRLNVCFGWTSFLWNTLFQYAVEDGADYFYQLNDDIKFMSSNWAKPLTEAIQGNGNFGVIGPKDRNNNRIFTQSFVHAPTHMDIFGIYFPPQFHNWYNDDWISEVYKTSAGQITLKSQVLVENTNAEGTRYEVCNEPGQELLNVELERTRAIVSAWQESHKSA